ncbi:hypothetical protein [Anaeromyxobacter sp. SG17]|uniref:hypothetical protein n=1 Tax=Anaeromyxobacter sp. SG17 TaxID=2925405 RepID=UPI001F59CFE7|nr:hypothetical protein [Anaeromyxobacter sp. SG17]
MNHRFALASLLLLASPALAADPTMKPFVLASRAPGDVDGAARTARQKLQAAGFEIAGSYAPYPGAVVLAVTNESLKSEAAKTPSGGYAAAQRVTITKVGEEVQVAYTNPSYMAAAYRLPGDLAPVAASLEGALGRAEEYGPSEGKSAKDLRKYHYMVGMEYFDEPSKLGHFASHDEAVKAIEAGLAERRGGASKVYRIDLPGGTQTVFGVALSDGCSGDARIMNEIDSKPLRSTGHLPYELLVTGGDVRALYARFRIAVNFPDLKMMGSHSFMNIRCAPDAIEKALKAVAGAR